MRFSFLRAGFIVAWAVVTFVLLTNSAAAQSLTVTWTHPTLNTDGSTIAAGTLASTRVEWGSCGATAGTFGTKAGETVAAFPATTATISSLAVGTYCVRAFSRNTAGAESAASAVVSKVIAPPVPRPPVLVTVNVVAYELNYSGSGVRLGRNVGTVPLGTACGAVVFGQYAEVPASSVTLTRPPKSQALVAQCRMG